MESCYIVPENASEGNRTRGPSSSGGGNGTQDGSDQARTLRHQVDWEGSTGTQVGACAGAGPYYQCASSPAISEADRLMEIEEPVNWTSFSLTARWNATTALSSELTLAVSKAVPCGPDCYNYTRIEHQTGGSPLVVEGSLAEVPANATIVVSVGDPSPGSPAASTWTDTDQPFHVLGWLQGGDASK